MLKNKYRGVIGFPKWVRDAVFTRPPVETLLGEGDTAVQKWVQLGPQGATISALYWELPRAELRPLLREVTNVDVEK